MVILITLNFLTFVAAYSETSVVDSGCCATGLLAKDFSAFYVGAWRLLHNPSNIYTPGAVNDGGPAITPRPESYKYLPSFLLVIVPFLALSYHDALLAFDAIQLLLLPLVAYLTYRLVRNKGTAVTLIVATVVLLQPSPIPHWGLSASYYWQWAEGQSKVLETFFLVSSFYAGTRGRPYLSGAALGMAAFDPRFTLISLPLFWFYNRGNLRRASLSFVGVFLASNFALLLPGVGSGFATMIGSSGASTPLFYYAYIPLLTVIALTIVNARDMARLMREGRLPRAG